MGALNCCTDGKSPKKVITEDTNAMHDSNRSLNIEEMKTMDLADSSVQIPVK